MIISTYAYRLPTNWVYNFMLWKSLHVQLSDDSNDTAVSAILMHFVVRNGVGRVEN